MLFSQYKVNRWPWELPTARMFCPSKIGDLDVWSSQRNQWCGLRPSVLEQDRSQTKNQTWSWSCRSGVVLWNTVLSHVIMISKDTATFQVGLLFIVSLFCSWNITTVVLWRSTVAFTYLKVKSAKCLCLLPVVLVLIGLGLKNLVLFTSLSETKEALNGRWGWQDCIMLQLHEKLL